MSIELKTKLGQIDISNEVIATIAGGAPLIAMASSEWPQKIKLKMD